MGTIDLRTEIRDFLSTRRARITPEEAGLPAYGGNRRVTGLRREEVAMLAGVSVDYYVRMERGSLAGASESVLEALADALRLDEAERAHLFALARETGRQDVVAARSDRGTDHARNELPFIDQHRLGLDVPPEVTWAALQHCARHSLGLRPGGVGAWALGTVPAAGFRVTAVTAGRSLALAGRHRFSRYELVFHVVPTGTGGSELCASSYAAFPGLRGGVYRTLVIRSGLHVVATRRILRAVRRQAQRPT
jgi:transcriptional regulator with XRE-family HTH domain